MNCITENNPVVMIALGITFFALSIASLIYTILKKKNPCSNYSELYLRIRTWWVIVILFSVALLSGKGAFVIFMAFVSFIAMKEFFSLIPIRKVDRKVLLWVYLAIPIQYWWVYSKWYDMFIIFIPVYMFLLIGLRLVLVGKTKGFLQSAGTIHWGLMTTVFCLSHVACLFMLPLSENINCSGQTLIFYLLFLTQINDIAQYIWGRNFGRTKIVPEVSPNKTVAGLIGGTATTTILAILLAPFMTPFNISASVCAGLIISLAGFFGDITISALKRDLEIKDCGSFLPGHGGILDRVDSLTFTAPLFLHFVRYFYT